MEKNDWAGKQWKIWNLLVTLFIKEGDAYKAI